MKDRFSSKVERFLNELGIEWHDVFGYTRGWNGESGKPCSFRFIKELERVYYKYRKDKLIINSDYYWSEGQLLKYMKEVGEIFSIEERFQVNRASTGVIQEPCPTCADLGLDFPDGEVKPCEKCEK